MRTRLLGLISAVLSLLPLPAAAVEITGPTQFYLMHASGLHMAKGADGGAVLEASDASSPQMLTLTPAEDGFYTISAPDNGGYLAMSGSWSTTFTDDLSTFNTQFAIDQVNDFYIKLRCRANAKYLGTDSNGAGAKVYSNKEGNDSRHYWYLSTDPRQLPQVNSVSYVVNPAARRQTVEGWGVSLCWWANMCGKWSDEKIDEIVDWLVNPEGLNFRIFRYNIGGGDDPDNANCTPHHMGNGKGLRAEMEGFKDSSDGPYIWTRDEAQRKIMLKIKEKRPDAIFEAFSNSAPWYMTYSGCVAGNTSASKDNLRPEYYEEFARYLVDVCKHYKDEYGIEFRTLDPFNEPMTNYWGANGGQEGCHFDVASQIEFLKVLAPILKESGLSTVISASDETSVAQSVKDFVAYRNAGILDLVGQWNTHTYTADNNQRAKISSLCAEENIPLWMSEVGAGGTGFAGNLGMAQKLINDMRFIMPTAWIDWQYIEENNDQWCLVKALSFAKGTYQKVRNYSVRSHFSRFIKEGYTILTTLNSKTLAALSPDRKEIVIVTINDGALDTRHMVDLSMCTSVGSGIKGYLTSENDELAPLADCNVENGIVSFLLPMQSIATIVIPVTVEESGATLPEEGQNYLIYPRTGADVALDAREGAVKIRSITLDKSQIWTLTGSGDGFLLTNGNGDILTESSPLYALTTNTSPADGQTFHITPINDSTFFRIENSDATKALDLEGEKSGDGTGVGVWTYGDTDAPAHRQWGFMPVPASSDPGKVLPVISTSPSESPVTVACAGDGVIKVSPLSQESGNISIYTAGGTRIYTSAMATEEILIPMARGYYIVVFSTQSGTATWGSPVIVR